MINTYTQISFEATHLPSSICSYNNKALTLEIQLSEHCLVCKVFYDFSPDPLTLCATILEKDQIKINLMPYRIELWVNGNLCDEEWPAGNCLFTPDASIESDINVTVGQASSEVVTEPSVISYFSNAEGWQPAHNIYVGDCMPYSHRGRYHVLHLKDRRHHKSKWGLGAHQWDHISTDDFLHWQVHPTAVSITDPREGSICTGSWIEHDEKEYLFYTVRMSDRSPALICRSISDDGYHFEKDLSFHFTLSEKYHGPSARDPKIIKDQDGLYHMILTTSLIKEGVGCLAHLTSRDLDHWEEVEEPIYTSQDKTQPECPDYFFYNGYYYLIFSLHGKAHYLKSKKEFEDWTEPNDPIIPCHRVPKAAILNQKLIFTGFKAFGVYGGTMTFLSASNNENGDLVF